MKQIFFVVEDTDMVAGAARFHTALGKFSPATTWSSTENFFEGIVSAAGTFRNLKFKISAAPGAAKSYQLTVRKNGAGTALTCTISGDTDTSAEDITHSFTVVAGDRVSIQITPSGTPNTAKAAWSMEFEGDNANENMVAITTDATPSTSARRYIPAIMGNSTFASTIDAQNNLVMPHDGTIKALYVNLVTAPGSGKSWAISIYKNGSEEASSIVTIADAATTGNVTGLSIDVAPGDTLQLSVNPTGTPTAFTRFRAGVLFDSDTEGNSIIGSTRMNPSNTTTVFANLLSGTNENTTTESQLSDIIGATDVTFKNLRFNVQTAPGSGKSWTATLRKNAGDTSLTATISDANTSATDTSNTVSFTANDLASMEITPSGTPTASPGITFYMTQFIGVNPTVQTITGKARVEKSVTQTATGTSRIEKSVTQTVTGVSRIAQVVNQTIQGLTRITASTLQTITGKARVEKSVTQDLTGVSRIEKSVSQAITGVTRVTASTPQTITGKARITTTTDRTISGKASILKTASQAITGVARISINETTQDITGIARIQKSVTQTVQGLARITATASQTISGKARIQKAVSQTVQGVARIAKSVTQTVTGTSRIQKSVTATVTGKAAILKTTTQTISGLSRIQKSISQTISGVSRITGNALQTITGKARVEKSQQQAITGKSRLEKSVTQTITGLARITFDSTTTRTITGAAKIIKPQWYQSSPVTWYTRSEPTWFTRSSSDWYERNRLE